MRKGCNGGKTGKKRGGNVKKKEKTDDYSGHYVIASSRPPERRPLERRTLVPRYMSNAINGILISWDKTVWMYMFAFVFVYWFVYTMFVCALYFSCVLCIANVSISDQRREQIRLATVRIFAKKIHGSAFLIAASAPIFYPWNLNLQTLISYWYKISIGNILLTKYSFAKFKADLFLEHNKTSSDPTVTWEYSSFRKCP